MPLLARWGEHLVLGVVPTCAIALLVLDQLGGALRASLDILGPTFLAISAGTVTTVCCSDLQSLDLEVADRKWGLANAFVNWRHLERSHPEETFSGIEPTICHRVLSTMLRSPLAFDSGFPGLFLFQPGTRNWKLWEVKGTDDTLRPEQEWWLP